MDEIFNFAKQQMNTYANRFGAVDPMQQDVAWGCQHGCSKSCYGSCVTGCEGSCSRICQNSCHSGCQNSCKHACESFGFGTQRRGW